MSKITSIFEAQLAHPPTRAADRGYQQLATQLRQAQLVLQRLEREVAAVAPAAPDAGFTAPGAFLFQLLGRLNLTSATWPALSSVLDQAASLLSADAVEGGRRTGARTGASRVKIVSDALDLAFASEAPLRPGQPPAHEGYRVHVHLQRHTKTGQLSPTLSYWCFWPGQAMQQLAEMKVGHRARVGGGPGVGGCLCTEATTSARAGGRAAVLKASTQLTAFL